MKLNIYASFLQQINKRNMCALLPKFDVYHFLGPTTNLFAFMYFSMFFPGCLQDCEEKVLHQSTGSGDGDDDSWPV